MKRADISDRTKARRLSPREQKPWVKWLLTVGLLFLATVGLLFLCLLIGTQNCSFKRLSAYFEQPLIFVMNILPMVLLLITLYALTNRGWIAWLSTAVFFLLFFYINFFKVALRGEPFVADDLFIAGEAMNIMGEYTLDIPLLLWVSLLLVAVGTLILARYARGRIPKKRWWIRALLPLLCVAFGAVAWTNWYTDSKLYDNTRLALQHTFIAFNNQEASASGGLVWSFLRSVDEALPTPPEGYDREETEAMLAEQPDVAIAEDKRVNVVVTMLESYSDLSLLDGIEFTTDPYTELHALQQESYHGTLVVDSIGGGTVNAERAFLTGFAYRQPKYHRNTASFVRYFSDNGYVTTGAHPGVGWFYDRDSINTYIGFDSYRFYENHFQDIVTEEYYYNSKGYANDERFFADCREAYEQRDTSVPYFSFSVTYQGHSPYNASVLRGGEYVSHNGLSDAAYYTVNNYLKNIAETGKAVADFVDSFRDDDEPVVLVFFGDHKPLLGDDNAYYEELGVLGQTQEKRQFSLYSTPYLIWANDAAKETLGMDFVGEGETISPCYLMSVLFDCCGWEGPSWLRLQRTLRPTLPVLNFRTYFLADGILTETLPPEAEEAFAEFEYAEYYIRQQVPD